MRIVRKEVKGIRYILREDTYYCWRGEYGRMQVLNWQLNMAGTGIAE